MNADRTPLGPAQAPLMLYLPNPPRYPDAGAPTDVGALIALNGNHWRKILTILAKLSTPDADAWRDYRDNELLHGKEAISFADRLEPGARLHLIGGKASWERLGFAPRAFEALDDEGRLFARGNVLLTPYPDYRQFPNKSIETARRWIGQPWERL